MSVEAGEGSARSLALSLKLIAVAGTAMFIGVNIWTGAPLLALWLGSRVVPQNGLSFAAVFFVVIALALFEVALLIVLSRLNEIYSRLSGAPVDERPRSPWLRSIRDEAVARPLSGVERILAVNVVVAATIFEIWFFFFAHMSVPGG